MTMPAPCFDCNLLDNLWIRSGIYSRRLLQSLNISLKPSALYAIDGSGCLLDASGTQKSVTALQLGQSKLAGRAKGHPSLVIKSGAVAHWALRLPGTENVKI